MASQSNKPSAKSVVTIMIVTTDLAEGLFDWEAIYKLFDNTVDVALEFPMATNEQIAAQVTMLRHAMEAL